MSLNDLPKSTLLSTISYLFFIYKTSVLIFEDLNIQHLMNDIAHEKTIPRLQKVYDRVTIKDNQFIDKKCTQILA